MFASIPNHAQELVAFEDFEFYQPAQERTTGICERGNTHTTGDAFVIGTQGRVFVWVSDLTILFVPGRNVDDTSFSTSLIGSAFANTSFPSFTSKSTELYSLPVGEGLVFVENDLGDGIA